MAEIILSEEQQAIVDYGIGNILVSAAAGSGKTTVLVERIVTKLIRGDFDVDSILVVTFTKDAASNMRSKLEGRLREAIKVSKDKDSKARLMKQLERLPNAYIQTFDSFCSRVIREKGYIADYKSGNDLLSPGNTILNESELAVLLLEAAYKALDELYVSLEGEDSINLTRLTYLFGNGRTDDAFLDNVCSVYNKIRALPNYNDYLDELILRREELDNQATVIGYDEGVRRIKKIISNIDENIWSIINDEILGNTKSKPAREKLLNLLSAFRSYYNNISGYIDDDERLLDRVRDVSMFNEIEAFPQIGESLQTSMHPLLLLFSLIKDRITYEGTYRGYKLSSGEENYYEISRRIITIPFNELLRLQERRTKLAKVYTKLLHKVDEYYLRIKSNLHGMDYSDQEHLCNLILSDEEAAAYYKSKFNEIYIDEYQDNSRLQDEIINKFSSGNVFRVGDVKQSIYKFRNAEPQMFMEKLDEFEQYGSDKNDQEGTLFLLNSNRRSVPEILEFVNALFEETMTKEGAEIEYDDTQKLNSPEGSVAGEEKPRIRLVDGPSIVKNNEEISAIKDNDLNYLSRGVLEEINYYLKEGFSYKDIYVLTRTRKASFHIARYLKENGIKASYKDSTDVFEDSSISALIAILVILSNERMDDYMLTVLLNPFEISNFTLDEIATVRAFYKASTTKSDSLLEEISFYSENGNDEALVSRTRMFSKWYSDMRADLVITDISEVMSKIYRTTSIEATLGKNAQKVNIFRDWLVSNYLSYGSDISAIANSLVNLKLKIDKKVKIESQYNYQDMVTCMTYHSSKGLDRPCVIVTDWEAASNKDKGSIYFDKASGLIIDDYKDDPSIFKQHSVETILFEERSFLEDNAEELRLLYVALTRAKRRLSVVGIVEGSKSSKNSSTDKMNSLIAELTELPLGKPLGSDFYLKYRGKPIKTPLLAFLLRSGGGHKLRASLEAMSISVSDFDGFKLIMDNVKLSNSEDEEDSEDIVRAEEVLALQEDEEDAILKPRVSCECGKLIIPEYKFQEETSIPFKTTVSAIAAEKSSMSSDIDRRALHINLIPRSFSDSIDRANGITGDSASQVGTLVHSLMRFIDLSGVKDDESLDKALIRLVENGIIARDKLNLVEPFRSGIISFAKSDIGRIISDSSKSDYKIYYEHPLVFSMKATNDEDRLVQGVIDLMLVSNNEAIIVDYKTDKLSSARDLVSRAQMAITKHKEQLKLYGAAVSSAGLVVKEKYIYLLRYGEFVRI